MSGSTTPQPMHVVIAGWRLGLEASGANRRLMALLEHSGPLLGERDRITVLHRPGAGMADAMARGALAGVGTRPLAIPAGPAWRRSRAEQQRLPAVLAELGATVFETGFRPIPRGLPCPATLTLHDLRDLHGWRRLPRRPARWLLQRTLRRAAAVTVPSAFTRDEAQGLCGDRCPPIHVVPNGVDPLFGYRAWTGNHGREYVLHVGHLEARKNLCVLIQGFARWQRSQDAREMDLLLVGQDHGEERRLRAVAVAEGVAPSVHFAGRVAEEELRDLYLRAAAVAVPSAYEGFGLCALEGLAAGAPVLVADGSALPEVVGDTGIVLPPDQPEAWAKGLARAMEQRDPRSIARRRGQASRFRWEDAAAGQLKVWRSVSG